MGLQAKQSGRITGIEDYSHPRKSIQKGRSDGPGYTQLVLILAAAGCYCTSSRGWAAPRINTQPEGGVFVSFSFLLFPFRFERMHPKGRAGGDGDEKKIIICLAGGVCSCMKIVEMQVFVGGVWKLRTACAIFLLFNSLVT